jgi:2-oxo-4-hydroxy-4-carboxy-5-ureidoimidazoline decarboxylase
MNEPHEVLNALDEIAAAAALRRCCGSERWVIAMNRERPYPSTPALLAAAERHWSLLEGRDLLEAFSQHPQIGEDVSSLRQRFVATHALSAREQSGLSDADEATLLALRDMNRAYRKRFGFIFIVCASGKSAHDMLALLRARLPNERAAELALAAAEQAKITALRLQGLAELPGLDG